MGVCKRGGQGPGIPESQRSTSFREATKARGLGEGAGAEVLSLPSGTLNKPPEGHRQGEAVWGKERLSSAADSGWTAASAVSSLCGQPFLPANCAHLRTWQSNPSACQEGGAALRP